MCVGVGTFILSFHGLIACRVTLPTAFAYQLKETRMMRTKRSASFLLCSLALALTVEAFSTATPGKASAFVPTLKNAIHHGLVSSHARGTVARMPTAAVAANTRLFATPENSDMDSSDEQGKKNIFRHHNRRATYDKSAVLSLQEQFKTKNYKSLSTFVFIFERCFYESIHIHNPGSKTIKEFANQGHITVSSLG